MVPTVSCGTALYARFLSCSTDLLKCNFSRHQYKNLKCSKFGKNLSCWDPLQFPPKQCNTIFRYIFYTVRSNLICMQSLKMRKLHVGRNYSIKKSLSCNSFWQIKVHRTHHNLTTAIEFIQNAIDQIFLWLLQRILL